MNGIVIRNRMTCATVLCLVTRSNMDPARYQCGRFRPLAERANSRSPSSFRILAEWTGLEPATPGVTGRYSNQLNYHSRTGPLATWWVLTGSNRRHSPCKGDALPAELSTRAGDGAARRA